MSQNPKKKRRKLPKNIVTRPDAEALELILGKRVKKALDKELSEIAEGVVKKGVSDSIRS